MKAVGYTRAGALDGDGELADVELPQPEPGDHDLLVKVPAFSVDPVDCHIRGTEHPLAGQIRVLGWDAAGVIVGFGESVADEPFLEYFALGDRVYYSGAVDRPGANAEYHLVDALLAAHAPTSLSDAAAALLPLASLIDWEMLFDRLEVTRPVPGAESVVLVIGGGGRVVSLAIQLLRALTNVSVIATVSRQGTKAWCASLGAHHILDHSQALAPQVAELGIGEPGYVFSTAGSGERQADIFELLAPQGRFGYVDCPDELHVQAFRTTCVLRNPEDAFMRSRLQTIDLAEQKYSPANRRARRCREDPHHAHERAQRDQRRQPLPGTPTDRESDGSREVRARRLRLSAVATSRRRLGRGQERNTGMLAATTRSRITRFDPGRRLRGVQPLA